MTSSDIVASFSSAANDDDDTDDRNNHTRDLFGGRQSQLYIPDEENVSLQQRQHIRRRTRRRTKQSNDERTALPSLADFVHRAKVLKQYRSFIRVAHFVDAKEGNGGTPASSGECRAALEEVRLSFKLGMKKNIDTLSKNMAYSEVRG